MMSLDPTVFAANARSSGEATKAPAMNAAAMIPPIFRLIMLWVFEKSHKNKYETKRKKESGFEAEMKV